MTPRLTKSAWPLTRLRSVGVRSALVSAALALGVTACGDSERRPIGSSCDVDTQCVSGMCAANLCVDPEGDADQDGVLNRIEVALGSDVFDADTDADGISDRDELDANFMVVDTDGDGRPDILESSLADADGDCVTDQFDARDGEVDDDKSPMIHVCSTQGLCASQVANLRVACPDGGAAVCVYDDVVGYANPEVSCDGVDENCDGSVDEAFVDGSGAANCGGPTPYVGSATGGGVVVTSDRFRAKITIGPAIVGPIDGPDYRVNIGANPREVDSQPAEGN